MLTQQCYIISHIITLCKFGIHFTPGKIVSSSKLFSCTFSVCLPPFHPDGVDGCGLAAFMAVNRDGEDNVLNKETHIDRFTILGIAW